MAFQSVYSYCTIKENTKADHGILTTNDVSGWAIINVFPPTHSGADVCLG